MAAGLYQPCRLRGAAYADASRHCAPPCAAADAEAAAEAKKRRAAEIGVDEFLDGAFKELGGDSDEDKDDEGAAAASDGSDSDEVRPQRNLCSVAHTLHASCVHATPGHECASKRPPVPWLRDLR